MQGSALGDPPAPYNEKNNNVLRQPLALNCFCNTRTHNHPPTNFWDKNTKSLKWTRTHGDNVIHVLLRFSSSYSEETRFGISTIYLTNR